MAKLLAESALTSMRLWLSIYAGGGATQAKSEDDGGAGNGGVSGAGCRIQRLSA